MFGLQPVSAGPLSASAAKIVHTGSATISAVATQSVTFTVLGTASLGTGSPFSLGFNTGFQQGISVIGQGTIIQEFLGIVTAISADGIVEKPGITSLGPTFSITPKPQIQLSPPTSIQTVGSLSGNSVLLLGGSTNLLPLASIQAVLVSNLDNFDEVEFTLYLDKLREITGYIDKSQSLNLYIDKQKAIELYLDKVLSHTKYIDKQRSFELVREK